MSHPTIEPFAALQAALEPQYRLERELGRGGMGVVFRATDTTLDRPVAIKVVHPELAAHPSIVRRFLSEARTIARLRHPGIVAVHAAGTAQGLLYYVMDEVEGETLRERLDREGRLSVADVVRIVADLASALDAAARAGVVHRDVKPENVLLERGSGRALLADFGIARAVAAEGVTGTGQGVAVGTPSYMSPEQAAGEEVDSRSDLYGLGVVAYEMLAGHPPFQGTNRVVVSKHIAERPVPIERVRPECPRALAGAVMRALEKHPGERWQTGEELRQAIAGERTIPVGRSARRPALLALAVALAAVGTTIGLAGRSDGPPEGVNPRHSILVLPFDNVRNDAAVDWMREGSVSMLGLNLSQWNDLTVVDQERLHDLLGQHDVEPAEDIGLDMARRLAREAGVWTVVLGDFAKVGDSLHLAARVYDVASGARISVARVDDRTGEDARPLFDALAAKLLDLSGAPTDLPVGLARSTTQSLAAYRSYLAGVDRLNRWDLTGAERDLRRAVAIDTTFGLAYYKLALTRGWLVGTEDSVADRAIIRATAHSANLPEHDRTVINAYRAFIEGEFAEARGLYQRLIDRDGRDADAWYGLGEAWFHDTAGPDQAPAFTNAIRAFRRTLDLDPNYALAYDHVQHMLGMAAEVKPGYALVAQDSFVLAFGRNGQALVDSATLQSAIRRARSAGLSTARSWVASQPATLRAHGAMVDAYLASGNYNAALGEVARFRNTTPVHPELPFVEARIRFASGDVDRAAAQLRSALDSVAPQDFRPYQGTPTVVMDIAAAANVFAYQGDLTNAAKALDLADQVRREVVKHPPAKSEGHWGESWRRAVLGELYAGVGVPASSLRQVWQSAAEAGRMAAPESRKHLVHSGASAAIGLFTGPSADSSALVEYRSMTGESLSPEVRALLALSRGDSTGARQMLADPDTMAQGMPKWTASLYTRPLAAQAWFLLGDYDRTLSTLRDFEPASLKTGGFDSRWGMLGRVRLLRAAAYEQLGRRAEARQEYRDVLAQWKAADSALKPFIRQAEQGLARLGEA
ncbi:MAG TPA: protein kinase [Gemmatimonadales bacterium]|nr:protein kinase [Gemmatimonadales bacterium]